MSLLGKIMVKLGLDSSEFQRGVDDARSTTESFGDKIKGMAVKAAAAVGVLELLKKAFNFSAEAYKTAAQAEGVERAFARLNNPMLLNDLRAATQGTVSDLELMQNAIQAKNFKIPLENLATYLKFASTRAKETGRNVGYLVQSIVLGVGRKSPLILDNLGISALEVREEFAKTGDMAKAVANIIRREMGDANDTVVSSKEKIGQASAAWENVLTVIGRSVIVKSTGDFFNKASAATANFLSSLVGVSRELGVNEQAVRTEGREINQLISLLTNVNTKEEDRRIILAKLQEIQPRIVEGLNSENIATKNLITTAKEYNKELVARIALAARQDTVTSAVNRQLEVGANMMNKEAEIAKYLLDLQGDLTTADIQTGRLNMAQGITRWSEITSEERAKIISDYSEIILGTDNWSSKMGAAYKLFTNNIMSLDKIRGVDLKPLISLAQDVNELTRELDVAADDAERAKKEVEDFKTTFSQLFDPSKPDPPVEVTTQFTELINQIQNTEAELNSLQRQAQAGGYTESLTESITTAKTELASLKDLYTALTSKEWGASIDKEKIADPLKESIAYFEDLISKAQLNLRLAVTDKDRAKFQTEIKEFQAEIDVRLNVPQTDRQVIEQAIKQYEEMQLAIPIGFGTPEEVAAAQQEWDRLASIIQQAKSEYENFPKMPDINPPVGSLAAFEVALAKVSEELQLAVTQEDRLNATSRQLELQLQKMFAETRGVSEDGIFDAYISGLDALIQKMREVNPEFAAFIEKQKELAVESRRTGTEILDIGSMLASGITQSMQGLGEALGNGDMENILAQAILIPMCNMMAALGSQLILLGLSSVALKQLIKNPYLAIAAGAALVALASAGTAMAQNTVNKTTGGSSSGANTNSFTGGYSSSGSSGSYAMQVAPKEPEVVVYNTPKNSDHTLSQKDYYFYT